METRTRRAVDGVYIAISCAAIILNLLLIIVASKLRHLKQDIKLSMVLACAGMTLSSTEIIILIYNSTTGNKIDSIEWGCPTRGPLDFLGLSFSMMLVSLIAISRFYRTINKNLPRVIIASYSIFIIYYVIIVIIAGYRSEFYMLSNGLDCSLLPQTSSVSWLVAFTFTGSLLIFLFMTFGCYMGILRQVMHLSKKRAHLLKPSYRHKLFTNNSPDLVMLQLDQFRRTRSRVIQWIATVSVVYFLLILPSCVMLLIEFCIDRPDGGAVDAILTVGNLCFALISLANPCLVIFAQSMMFNTLKIFLKSFLRNSSSSDTSAFPY